MFYNLLHEYIGTHLLSAPDHNTIQCKVTKGVTYIPIPTGAGQNFAGLLTVDLPPTIHKGQEFNIIVRRITTRQNRRDVVITKKPAVSNTNLMTNWRYVVGTFQIKIPVSTKEVILFPEENTLAILRWRLKAMSPRNRWYPVIERYISYVAGRVDGLGGNSSEIKPSLEGLPTKGIHKKEYEYTGKVCEVIYDCFGDFEGFVISTCSEKRLFRSHEKRIGEIILRACKEGLLVSVSIEEGKLEKIL